MDEAVLGPSLDGNRLVLRDNAAAFAGRPGLDQDSTEIVGHDELVAEDLRDLALHGHQAPRR